MIAAIFVDRLSLDIFHRHIGTPVRRDSRVDQPRDTGMLKPRQQAPFAHEGIAAIGRFGTEKFERNELRKIRRCPAGEIHLAHAATADQALDGETANLLTLCQGRIACRLCGVGFHRRRGHVQYAFAARSGKKRRRLPNDMLRVI